MSLLGTDETKLNLSVAGIHKLKDLTGEIVSVEVFDNNHDEFVTFHIHPNTYIGNRRYDTSQIKNNKQLKVLVNERADLRDVTVVLGYDNFHLFFPVCYRKCWPVKTKVG